MTSYPTRPSIRIPNPCLLTAGFVLAYGLLGYFAYGRWLADLSVAARATQFPSVPYSSVLAIHVAAAALVALPGLLRPFIHIPIRPGRVTSSAEVLARSRLAWLSIIPLIFLLVGGGAPLLSRSEYIDEWAIPAIFRLGSVGFTPACLVLLGISLSAKNPREPGQTRALLLLAAYLCVGLSMATREMVVPAVALAVLLVRRRSSNKTLTALVALIAAQASITVSLGLRSSGAHGLRHYIAQVGRRETWTGSSLDPIANLLNGFHGSGAALWLDSGSGLGPQLTDLANPLFSASPAQMDALDFGFRYPIPSIGFAWTQGPLTFITLLFALGLALFVFGRVAEALANRDHIPALFGLVGLPISFAVAALAAIFLVQYKLYSTAVPLRLAIAGSICGFALIKLGDFALRNRFVR